jgi:hypothetical protein
MQGHGAPFEIKNYFKITKGFDFIMQFHEDDFYSSANFVKNHTSVPLSRH